MSTSQSGLGRLKRDWSNASDSAASSSAELIEWEPTQRPKKPEPPGPTNDRMENANKRLLLIRQALASMNAEKPAAAPVTKPLSKSTVADPNRPLSKRPSLDQDDGAPVKKRRELPASWRDDTLSDSGFKGRSWPIATSSTQESSISSTSTLNSSASSTSTRVNRVAGIFLSQEQTHILKLVEEGCSVFYTGSAGTGKSVLLREIIRHMKDKYKRNFEAVAVTASTGIAACNIGGVTIHSFAGIGLGDGTVPQLVSKIRKNRKAAMRWTKARVLIIDEVSMLDGELFDKLAEIACIIKKRPTEPFGGIQLIVTGDFFQLPPVTKFGEKQVKFAFEGEHWNATVKKTFNLTKVFRQKDQEFVDMLNEMRFGRLSQKSIAKFRSLSRNVVYHDGLGPTELFPRREDVEKSNAIRMQRLENAEEMMFEAIDGGLDASSRDKILANFMAPKQLRLRVNAQVMLIKNVDEQLVNGTMGRVLEFGDAAGAAEGDSDTTRVGATGSIPKKTSAGAYRRWPLVEFSLASGGKKTVSVSPETWKVETQTGEIQASRTQLPLILAWAMSIHKSQGQTLERVKVDLNRIFEKGQAYVALSRATSLDGLQVLNFDPRKVNAHEKVAEWSRTLETIGDNPLT